MLPYTRKESAAQISHKRDHFAELAMQAIIQSDVMDVLSWEHIAESAYRAADAMLKERQKRGA